MGCGSSKDTNIDAVSVEVGTPGENPKPESASKDKAGWRGRLKSSRRRWKRKSIEKQRTPLQIGGGDADGDAAPLPVSSRLVHESKLQELHDKYDLDNMWELGKGACGSVHAIKLRSTGDTFAMKTVTLAMANLDSFDELKQELEMQKRLDHPNIAKVRPRAHARRMLAAQQPASDAQPSHTTAGQSARACALSLECGSRASECA